MQNNKNAKQEMQQKYLELQMLIQQSRQLQQQAQFLEQQFIELKTVEDNLSSLEKIKPDTNSFSLIGAGIFAESKIKDAGSVIVKVSHDVAVKQTIPEAKKIIQTQLKEIENALVNTEHYIIENFAQTEKLESEFQALSKS